MPGFRLISNCLSRFFSSASSVQHTTNHSTNLISSLPHYRPLPPKPVRFEHKSAGNTDERHPQSSSRYVAEQVDSPSFSASEIFEYAPPAISQSSFIEDGNTNTAPKATQLFHTSKEPPWRFQNSHSVCIHDLPQTLFSLLYVVTQNGPLRSHSHPDVVLKCKEIVADGNGS